MKTPADPNDPLMRSLAEEAADLPLMAASEARRTRALRMKQRRQVTLSMTVLMCGLCAWQIYAPRDKGRGLIATHTSPEAPMNVAKHLIVRTEEQARNEPLPLPDGLTANQAKVVLAAQGLPLLLIRDHTGRVARIHFIERQQ